MKTLLFIYLLLLFVPANMFSQKNAQFRGPNRDGKYHNEKLLKKWPDNGPRLVQTISGLGFGYSSPTVTKDRIYVTGMTDSIGYLLSFNPEGKLLWKKEYGKVWTERFPGARANPTVVDDKIYFSDTYGKVYCFNENGEKEWTVDMEKEFGFRTIDYGANEALLIEGDKLFCTPGGTEVMIAVLNRHNGKTIKTIKGNGQKSSHCSPIIVKHENKKLLLTMTGQAVVGVDLENYQMVFQEEISNKWGVNPNIPVYKDGYIFLSTYVTGSKVIKIDDEAKSATKIWELKEIDIEAEDAVEIDGYIYCGAAKGRVWYCVEMKTGKIMYADRETIKKANVSFADSLLYTYNSSGYVRIIKPDPNKLEILGEFKVENGSKEHIARLVINNGKLFVRHGKILNIYDISRGNKKT